MAWLILCAALIVASIVLLILRATVWGWYDLDWLLYVCIAILVTVTIVLICCLAFYCCGREYVNSYSIQAQFYEDAVANAGNTEVIYHTDIAELNRELASAQGHYKTWGKWWSFYPEEVMDLKPIGVSN